MSTISVNESNFESEVLQSAVPVVVDFWAEWCGPCKAIAPALEEIASEHAGKVKIVKLNIDENQSLAVQYNVRSIPTLLLFKGGEAVSVQVGAVAKAKMSQWIEGEL